VATPLWAVLGRARHSVRAVCAWQAAGRGLPALPSWLRVVAAIGVFLFRVFYFPPFEDDLDLDEERR
jgi:hypothetical protein